MFLANKLNKGAGVPTPKDAQFNYVTMLLHGDGTNGAQNNTFLDSSTNNFTITRNGNTTQGSFSPYGSNWSNYFDGSSSLSLATATALGTGNVTVEFWFYPTDISATYRDLYEGRSSVNSNTGFAIFQYGQTIEIYGNGLKVSSAASAFPANAWTHFAVVRTSGTCQIYINGVASGSSGSYSDNFTSTVRKIGDAINSFPYIGYISNLREVTSAVYSATFTPPTAPVTAAKTSFFDDPMKFISQNKGPLLLAGGAGLLAANSMNEKKAPASLIESNKELTKEEREAKYPWTVIDQSKFTNNYVAPTNQAPQYEWQKGVYETPKFVAAKGGIADIRSGGHLEGPGTGTSDSIPAKLSDGEFVMTAKAVRGAGGGDRMKGAKKMYELMHKFERVA